MTYRTEDARLDAAIEDMLLRDLGVIEDDQPTEYSHHVHQEAVRAEFTPAERVSIRVALGLLDG